MLRIDNEVRVTPSVLDRLIDYDPQLSSEPVASRSKSLRLMKLSVKRDLEWLLNTRQVATGIPPGLKEVNHSVAAYGLPDFTTASIKSPSDQTRLRRAIETALIVFEPRLQDIVVTLEPMRETERLMHFRIDARLRIEPSPEPVTFDTVLQLATGQYTVQGD